MRVSRSTMVALCALLAWAPIVAVASYSCDASAELHAPSSPDGCDVIGDELGDLPVVVGPCGASAPAGIQWPQGGAYGTLELLLEPAKETTYANGDPMPSITNQGALVDVAPVQAVLASQPTFQNPCGVGPAIACAYADGGDWWQDAIARAELSFLHNGTGATCYLVAELMTGTALNATFFTTRLQSSIARGFYVRSGQSTAWRWQASVGNGAALVFSTQPGGGVGLIDGTAAAYWTHSSSRVLDLGWGARGYANTGEVDYAAAPDMAAPSQPLSVFSVVNGAAFSTSSFFALGCYSAVHGVTELAGVLDAIEAETGPLPQ